MAKVKNLYKELNLEVYLYFLPLMMLCVHLWIVIACSSRVTIKLMHYFHIMLILMVDLRCMWY